MRAFLDHKDMACPAAAFCAAAGSAIESASLSCGLYDGYDSVRVTMRPDTMNGVIGLRLFVHDIAKTAAAVKAAVKRWEEDGTSPGIGRTIERIGDASYELALEPDEESGVKLVVCMELRGRKARFEIGGAAPAFMAAEEIRQMFDDAGNYLDRLMTK